MDDDNSITKALARLSLIAVIAIGVVGALIFISIYGVMRNPDADYTMQAVGTLLTTAGAVAGAIIALLKSGGGE